LLSQAVGTGQLKLKLVSRLLPSETPCLKDFMGVKHLRLDTKLKVMSEWSLPVQAWRQQNKTDGTKSWRSNRAILLITN
jgi:hypothetical protein